MKSAAEKLTDGGLLMNDLVSFGSGGESEDLAWDLAWENGSAARVEPQMPGVAEPFSVTMNFGELPANRPLVLALNGWLRFGGGMANIAASLDANLPFPFPTLEADRKSVVCGTRGDHG